MIRRQRRQLLFLSATAATGALVLAASLNPWLCARLVPDWILARFAPLDVVLYEIDDANPSLSDMLAKELFLRARVYPHRLNPSSLCTIVNRLVQYERDKGTLIRVTNVDAETRQVSCILAFPRLYECQRDIVVEVFDDSGERLVTFRPWRWSFSMVNPGELPFSHAEFGFVANPDATHVVVTVRVHVLPDGYLDLPPEVAIDAEARLAASISVQVPLDPP